MACCYSEDCGEYAVTPMLVTPCYPTCEDPPICFPCLPRCPKGVMYCCDKKPPRTPPRTLACCDEKDECEPRQRDYSPHRQRRPRSPPPTRQSSYTAPQDCCPTCCHPTCKPIKTKYVIPCYRYEDGRIQNQPTVLMRRACEVAVGARARKKPFMVSSYSADTTGQVSRFHSEDERGNCCYHFERKKACCNMHPDHHQPHVYHSHLHACHSHPCHLHECPSRPCRPCQPCTSSPECQFVDCVHAKAVDPAKSCCFYC